MTPKRRPWHSMPFTPHPSLLTVLITQSVARVVQMMATAEAEDRLDEAELVHEVGGATYVGYERVPNVIVRLLRACAIKDVSDGKQVERYVLNETGQRLLAEWNASHPAS